MSIDDRLHRHLLIKIEAYAQHRGGPVPKGYRLGSPERRPAEVWAC